MSWAGYVPGAVRFPVGENDRLVGIITDMDIALRAAAKGNPPDRCTVREVMSPGVKYVFEDETTQAAADSMSGLQIGGSQF